MAEITVAGFDPSFRNWGMAKAALNMEDGYLSVPELAIVQTEEPKKKDRRGRRQSAIDIDAAHTLFSGFTKFCEDVDVLFIEVPHGSQSASAMKGYGICIGLIGSFIFYRDIQVIQVSEAESKIALASNRTATKEDMIAAAMSHFPTANWPMHGKKLNASKAEHMADAYAAIVAGVQTPAFQKLREEYARISK